MAQLPGWDAPFRKSSSSPALVSDFASYSRSYRTVHLLIGPRIASTPNLVMSSIIVHIESLLQHRSKSLSLAQSVVDGSDHVGCGLPEMISDQPRECIVMTSVFDPPEPLSVSPFIFRMEGLLVNAPQLCTTLALSSLPTLRNWVQLPGNPFNLEPGTRTTDLHQPHSLSSESIR